MAQGGAAAATAQAAPAGGPGGNPFQLASNLYAEKNNVGAITGLTTTAGGSTVGGGQINAGQYLRALRLIFRTSTAGTVATAGALPPICRGTSSRRLISSTWTARRSSTRWAGMPITSR